MSTGKVHETTVAPNVSLEKGDAVVFDNGYINFSWFRTL
jgi:hypothetical protein